MGTNNLLTDMKVIKEEIKGIKETFEMSRMTLMAFSQLARNMEDRMNRMEANLEEIRSDVGKVKSSLVGYAKSKEFYWLSEPRGFMLTVSVACGFKFFLSRG